ncbi:MAG: GLPGLI family protein [Bacteroidota bacterium]|nr:GLPGLI family protein [Bacteroidota bacterium]
MKKIYCLISVFLIIQSSGAQNNRFITEGRIEFERKVNLHSQINGNDTWQEEYKKTLPKIQTTYFNLLFSNNKTLYKPGREVAENNKINNWWALPAQDNIIYTDLDKQQSISEKNLFEKYFLITDSTRKINWKITDEKKNIAGFECRRANAIIMDSIYVVAFYTDEIITPGGPESFTGLPGMILGVALPHEHITWFATKLFTMFVNETDLKTNSTFFSFQ